MAIEKRFLFLLTMLVVSLATVVLGQTDTAEVRGVVLYRSKKPAVNCVVEIATKFNYVDGNGKFRIFNVPTGRQTLSVACGGHILKQEVVVIHAPVENIPEILLPR